MTRPFKIEALMLCLLGGEGQREPHGEWQLHIQIAIWDPRLHIRREKNMMVWVCVWTQLSLEAQIRQVFVQQTVRCHMVMRRATEQKILKCISLVFLERKLYLSVECALEVKTSYMRYQRTEYLLINVLKKIFHFDFWKWQTITNRF